MIARRYPVVLSEKGKRLKNRAAYFGVFAALALILSYVETLIPVNFGIPGAKLGLANLVIVVVLYKTDFKEALLLSVTRVVLAGFIFGNLFDWTVCVSSPGVNHYYALRADDYALVKSLDVETASDEVPGLSFTSPYDRYVRPRF